MTASKGRFQSIFRVFCCYETSFTPQDSLKNRKKLSLLKVSAHSGRVLLETVEHILFDGHASIDWLKKLDKTAKKLMWNMSRRIKLIPSKTNRAKGKGVFCVIKELQRKTRVPLRALT